MAVEDIFIRIKEINKITKSEKKIIRFLEKNYSTIALESTDSIAKKSGVSRATVVRFLAKMGYGGLSDLKKNLKGELLLKLGLPMGRYHDRKFTLQEAQDDFSCLQLQIRQAIEDIDTLPTQIVPAQFNDVVAALADCKGTIYLQGTMASHAIARFFYSNASYVLNNLTLLHSLDTNMFLPLSEIEENDILFAITEHRYSRTTYEIMKWFHKKGAKIVLLSDQKNLEHIKLTSLQLTVKSTGLSLFNSACSRIVVLEAIITALAKRMDKDIYTRSKKYERLFRFFSVFQEDE